jgi:hypothetical protein
MQPTFRTARARFMNIMPHRGAQAGFQAAAMRKHAVRPTVRGDFPNNAPFRESLCSQPSVCEGFVLCCPYSNATKDLGTFKLRCCCIKLLILQWILGIHSQREKPGLIYWITVASHTPFLGKSLILLL